jgi:hypothetical protein
VAYFHIEVSSNCDKSCKFSNGAKLRSSKNKREMRMGRDSNPRIR